MLKKFIPNFDQLTQAQKLLLLEELWDNLASQPENIPMPQWHKEELDLRYQEYLKNPADGSTWTEVRERLSRSLH